MRGLAAALAGAVLAAPAVGQAGYVPAPENLAARAWFQDAKFGRFIVLRLRPWLPSSPAPQLPDYQAIP